MTGLTSFLEMSNNWILLELALIGFSLKWILILAFHLIASCALHHIYCEYDAVEALDSLSLNSVDVFFSAGSSFGEI